MQVILLPASWIHDPSSTLRPETSTASPNVISLLESESGRLRFGVPAGATTGLCGPAAHPVKGLVRLAKEKASTTPATCGHRSSSSSASAALQRSLGNRLRRQLGSDGGT